METPFLNISGCYFLKSINPYGQILNTFEKNDDKNYFRAIVNFVLISKIVFRMSVESLRGKMTNMYKL